jgi:hypothetical protein
MMSGRAEQDIGDPLIVAASSAALAADLIAALLRESYSRDPP